MRHIPLAGTLRGPGLNNSAPAPADILLKCYGAEPLVGFGPAVERHHHQGGDARIGDGDRHRNVAGEPRLRAGRS